MSFLNLHQPENDHPSQSSEQHVFSCSYCSRKFYSPQAFGGHQNAHKVERTLAKKSRELSSVARHKPEWNRMSSGSGFDANGSTHVGQVQQPMVVGIQHQEVYAYKGVNVEDDINHLDLSLRL